MMSHGKVGDRALRIPAQTALKLVQAKICNTSYYILSMLKH